MVSSYSIKVKIRLSKEWVLVTDSCVTPEAVASGLLLRRNADVGTLDIDSIAVGGVLHAQVGSPIGA